MDIINIESLITEGRIVTTANIDPTNDYVVIGKFQTGNRKRGAANANAYKSYVIPLSELLGGGSPITLNVIPRGTGPAIADGTWAFSGNTILPLTTGSNIGSLTKRVDTIFMASTFDYASDLIWYNGAVNTMTLSTAGNLGVGASPITTSRVRIAGTDGGTVNLALLVENNISDPLFSVRNDGRIFVGFPQSGLGAPFGHTIAAINNTPGEYAFVVGSSGLNNDYLILVNGGAFSIGNLAGPVHMFSGNGLNRFSFTGGTNDQRVGINVAPSASLHIHGEGNTAATYSVIVEDNGGPALVNFTIKDNGEIAMPRLPVSDAGLVAGDVYADTAVNILANGDLVLAYKQ